MTEFSAWVKCSFLFSLISALIKSLVFSYCRVRGLSQESKRLLSGWSPELSPLTIKGRISEPQHPEKVNEKGMEASHWENFWQWTDLLQPNHYTATGSCGQVKDANVLSNHCGAMKEPGEKVICINCSCGTCGNVLNVGVLVQLTSAMFPALLEGFTRLLHAHLKQITSMQIHTVQSHETTLYVGSRTYLPWALSHP
ncbi:hypothetical protein PO909_012507 [Leuciscus waleckii]